MEIKDSVVKGNISYIALTFETKTRISRLDINHHITKRDFLCVEAETPSQCGIRLVPVDDENSFILAFANPEKDVCWINGRIDSGWWCWRCWRCGIMSDVVNHADSIEVEAA